MVMVQLLVVKIIYKNQLQHQKLMFMKKLALTQ